MATLTLVFDQPDRDAYTLRKVVELRVTLVFECRNCRKVAQADPLKLIERFGTGGTLGEIGKKARCRQCRKLGADMLMRASAMRGDLSWFPHPPRRGR